MEGQASPYRSLEAIGEILRSVGEHGERAHRNRHKAADHSRKAIPDPTIAAAAHSLAEEAWEEIGRLRAAGMPWHQAREQVMTPKLKGWQKAYGKECASEAFGHVMSLHPIHDAQDYVREAEDDRLANVIRRERAKAGRPLGRINEWFLRVTGMPLY